METPEFVGFHKIPRLNRDCVVTEKIDGTNAQILFTEEEGYVRDVFVGSRNRWITPEDDNHGFAAWVDAWKIPLFELLGAGRHFGEWWGNGINRNYGLTSKRFTLFNTERWAELPENDLVSVVPTLYVGPFNTHAIEDVVFNLKHHGSVAVPGFTNPEGVVVFHKTANQLFKVTCEDDEKPKGQP